ncbi:MAG: archease [Elusimicrobiales bacterium]|nr:archease [Elusimicrobiales bacterium]
MPFDLIDSSGDIGVRAWGPDAHAAFSALGEGFYSLLTDASRVSPSKGLSLSLSAPTLETLTVKFLNELIHRAEQERFLGAACDARYSFSAGEHRLSAVILGERFSSKKHARRLMPKAATYHELKAGPAPGGWEIRVTLDL